jgi:hypothetical protein
LTALGYNACPVNTGAGNVAVGYQVGLVNTTGAQLTAIGWNAAQSNTTGTANTVVGYSAFNTNTTGSNNTAMGQGALVSNTTGGNNTTVGYQSGYTNTTGGFGVYLGYQAGYTTNATYGNVCIGYRVGYSLTGGGNTLVGALSTAGADGAGTALTTGTQNSFFGTSAGNVVTTGSKNVIIGSYSGNQGGLDIRTASNYIVLSDGDGNPRGVFDASGNFLVGATSTYSNNGINVTSAFVTPTSGAWALAARSNHASNPYGLNINYQFAAPNGTSNEFLLCTDSGALRASIRSNGGLANFSANNVNLSDERTKTDIQDAGNYLAKICAIPVRTFKYKDQTDDLLNLGCIAQEVEAVAPELIDVSGFGETPEDGVPLKAIYQTDLQYALMKAIQELKAELDAYKATHP